MSRYDNIKDLRQVYDYNIAVLELWEHVEVYLPEDVCKEIKAFTFSDKFLDRSQREQNIREMNAGKKPTYCGFNYHNAVRLNSGDIQEIPLVERPKIPDNVKVSKKEQL